MQESTRFLSTRDYDVRRSGVPFIDAVLEGLSSDGGLYFPKSYVSLQEELMALPENVDFIDLAAKMTHGLFSEDFTLSQAYEFCHKAFTFSPALTELNQDILLLELFHGPSCAFKDFGASFLAVLMEHHLMKYGTTCTILTATSGDTGSAVAQAFHNVNNINVAILYPSGRVSPLQEKQLTGVGDNIFALEVRGTFDDCQRMVKEAFEHTEVARMYNLSSANSINIGRLIPQSFYYMYAWNILRHKNNNRWMFCTPSGNFGNLTAGLLAMRWGLPVLHFLIACNANDIVPHYLNTGHYVPRQSIPTLANAMDVGHPSNYERMYTMYAKHVQEKLGLSDIASVQEAQVHQAMQGELQGICVSDEQIKEEIHTVYREDGYFICPHTAVGVKASKDFLKTSWANTHGYSQVVVLSTAHASKFSEIIQDVTGKSPQMPHQLTHFLHKKKVSIPTDPTLEDLVDKLHYIHTIQ